MKILFLGMLFDIHSTTVLCSLRLGPAGQGALGSGQGAAAASLLPHLLLQGRRAPGSCVSPERAPHTRWRFTADRQISFAVIHFFTIMSANRMTNSNPSLKKKSLTLFLLLKRRSALFWRQNEFLGSFINSVASTRKRR